MPKYKNIKINTEDDYSGHDKIDQNNQVLKPEYSK